MYSPSASVLPTPVEDEGIDLLFSSPVKPGKETEHDRESYEDLDADERAFQMAEEEELKEMRQVLSHSYELLVGNKQTHLKLCLDLQAPQNNAIGHVEAGESQSAMARCPKVSKSTIGQLWHRYQQRGTTRPPKIR
ncbi:UNVERIFIED_CONTAM: hypothetical protein FKN15_011860 [Acipenser sinensis]